MRIRVSVEVWSLLLAPLFEVLHTAETAATNAPKTWRTWAKFFSKCHSKTIWHHTVQNGVDRWIKIVETTWKWNYTCHLDSAGLNIKLHLLSKGCSENNWCFVISTKECEYVLPRLRWSFVRSFVKHITFKFLLLNKENICNVKKSVLNKTFYSFFSKTWLFIQILICFLCVFSINVKTSFLFFIN